MDADLSGANLPEANLERAFLPGAKLCSAKLFGANLGHATLTKSDLNGAYLNKATLIGTDLSGTNLNGTNLFEADLTEADLSRASLVETNIERAKFTGCSVYGVSVWKPHGSPRDQSNLIITPPDEPRISVDNLEVAQFVYLLLNNENIRNVIDTVGKKAVLILGRFTQERKRVLDALRDELRHRNYLPILFDFEEPFSRDITETVVTLAHMARFIIADITDAKSIPQELQAIVPHLPSVPVQPLIASSAYEYAIV